MRNLLLPAAAATLLAASSLAFAASPPHHTSGMVKAFDGKAMTLSLNDGSTYSLPKTFKDPGLKSGEKVSVTWDQAGARKVAESVTIQK